MQVIYKSDPRLIFEVEYHPEEPATGEYKYSLGEPKIPAYNEITAVAWSDGYGVTDITEFVKDHCEKLFTEWEEALND